MMRYIRENAMTWWKNLDLYQENKALQDEVKNLKQESDQLREDLKSTAHERASAEKLASDLLAANIKHREEIADLRNQLQEVVLTNEVLAMGLAPIENELGKIQSSMTRIEEIRRQTPPRAA